MRLFLCYIAALLCYTCHAQKQNHVWAFGDSTGISFNTSPPAIITTNMKTHETVASVCNRHSGALMFYTDGFKVWDANNNEMPNGSGVGIDKNRTTSQGAVIVPAINDSNRYYLFTLSSYIQKGELHYSVIDMTLNNGMGDVVAGQKAIVLEDGFTESMTAVEYCNAIWLIVAKRYSRNFYAYRITDTGIASTPVISTTAYNAEPRTIASMKVSPDREKLAIAVRGSSTNTTYVGLLDFDGKTGKLSNGMLIDEKPGIEFYGCEFSPNSKFLYISGLVAKSIYQYDISLANAQSITASRSTVKANLGWVGGMQLAVDGNIYIAIQDSGTIDRISNCDTRFPGCTYNVGAVDLIDGKAGFNFPQLVVYPRVASIEHTTTSIDKVLCKGSVLNLQAPTGSTGYLWQDGSTDQRFIATTPGIYWVRSYGKCNDQIDTTVVTEVEVIASINDDTTICIGDELTLRSDPQPLGTSFLWSNGSTDDTMVIGESGRYGLQIDYKGCSDTDEVIVTHYPRISIELGNDTQICKDNVYTLPLIQSADYDAKYLWQDGSTGRTFDVTQAGNYHVTVSNQCQTIADSVVITTRNCHLFFPSAFSPNGDGLNDFARLAGDVGAVKGFTLRIYNRWGEAVYQTHDASKGWGGYYKGQKAEVGTYYYIIKYEYNGEEGVLKGDLMLIR